MGSLITEISGILAPPLPTSRGTPTSSSSISLRSSTSSAPSSARSSSSVSPSSTLLSSTSSTSSTTESISSSSSPPLVTRTTVVVEPSLAPPPSLNTDSSSNTSFLQNKVASGFVFAIVGIVGLILVMFVATFFIRRRKNKRLIDDAVSFDPVTVGHDDLEKAMQSSSLGHGSHEAKGPHMYNQYSPPPHYHGGPPPPANYTPHMAAQLYAPPVRYSSPPPPLPMQQQHSHLQRHLSYNSAMSSAEEANYSRPMSDETRGVVGPPIGRQIPDDIRRQYSNAG